MVTSAVMQSACEVMILVTFHSWHHNLILHLQNRRLKTRSFCKRFIGPADKWFMGQAGYRPCQCDAALPITIQKLIFIDIYNNPFKEGVVPMIFLQIFCIWNRNFGISCKLALAHGSLKSFSALNKKCNSMIVSDNRVVLLGERKKRGNVAHL